MSIICQVLAIFDDILICVWGAFQIQIFSKFRTWNESSSSPASPDNSKTLIWFSTLCLTPPHLTRCLNYSNYLNFCIDPPPLPKIQIVLCNLCENNEPLSFYILKKKVRFSHIFIEFHKTGNHPPHLNVLNYLIPSPILLFLLIYLCLFIISWFGLNSQVKS